MDKYSSKRAFHNYVDIILLFRDRMPTSVGTLFILNMEKNKHFWTTYQSTSSCQRSYWMTPNNYWFLCLHQHRFLFRALKRYFHLIVDPHETQMWETLLPNDKNPLLNSKIPQVTTLDKKNVAVFLRQQLAVSKSTDLIMKLIVATCENQGWELRIVTDRFFSFSLFFFFFPS